MNLRVVVSARDSAHRFDAGDGRWFAIRAAAEETAGALGVVEFVHPPGDRVAPHVHSEEDETFYVLEGTCTFHIDERDALAGPGTLVFIPRGTPHHFTVGAEGAHLLFWFTPAGPEGFFPAAHALRERSEAPVEHEWVELGRRYHVEPPPG